MFGALIAGVRECWGIVGLGGLCAVLCWGRAGNDWQYVGSVVGVFCELIGAWLWHAGRVLGAC